MHIQPPLLSWRSSRYNAGAGRRDFLLLLGKDTLRRKELHLTSSIKDHFPFVFQNFKLAYIGIFAPHVWIFCITHRYDIDHGGVTLGIPLYLALSACMFVVMLFAWKRPQFKTRPVLDWLFAGAMSLATIFLVFPFSFTGAQSTLIAAVVAGFGIAWLYLGWAPFFAKLDIRNAIACIFGAMAVGSAIKILIDLMDALPALLCLMALPFASIIFATVAQKQQPPLEREPRIYYEGSRTSVPWRVLVGVAVYSIIIGIIRTMPVEASFFSYEAQIFVHHGAEIIIAALVLWWVFMRHGLLRFSGLWRMILLFTATGLFFLPIIGSQGAGLALVLIDIAQTLVVMLFWVMLADVAHHSSVSPYTIFGSGWMAYSLSFAVGEIIGKVVGAYDVGLNVLLLMAYFLTLAAVFALNENSLAQRRIFADLDIPVPEKSLYGSIDAGSVTLGEKHGLTAREIEVLQLLCKGRSKAYIAENLFISENTVRSHSKHIYEKLQVHSKQEILDLITE